MASAFAGAAAVLMHIFNQPVSFAPRREYDLELRFALSPFSRELPPKEEKKEKVLDTIPERFLLDEGTVRLLQCRYRGQLCQQRSCTG